MRTKEVHQMMSEWDYSMHRVGEGMVVCTKCSVSGLARERISAILLTTSSYVCTRCLW